MGIRTVLVEDDLFMRGILSDALKARGVQVLGQYATAAEAAKMPEQLKPNVAVLDLHLGSGPSGLDVAMFLRKRNPYIGLVFLTSFDDPRLLNPHLPKLPHNASYLTKSKLGNIDELLMAMSDAALGINGDAHASHSGSQIREFTDTQLETLRLVAQGYSNAEIASRRFVTQRSVEISIARIAKTLGLAADATRNQRVHMARVYFRAMGRSPVDEE